MILTCPDCATSYSAKDEAIGPNGRTVRCSKCDATWFIGASPDELALHDLQKAPTVEEFSPADYVADEPEPFVERRTYPSKPGAHVMLRRRKEDEARAKKMVGIRAIWGVTLLALLTAIGLGVAKRHEIVKQHPRTATIYQAFGMDVSRSGFRFEDMKTRSSLIDGQPVFLVNGTVRNNRNSEAAPPLVELSFLDVADVPIYTWFVEVDADSLPANASADFAAQYPNPPLDAVAMRYRFSQDAGAVPSEFGVNEGEDVDLFEPEE